MLVAPPSAEDNEADGYDEEDGVRIKRFQIDSDGRKLDGTEEDVVETSTRKALV